MIKDRQCNGQMIKDRQCNGEMIKDRQCNGQNGRQCNDKGADNAMAK